MLDWNISKDGYIKTLGGKIQTQLSDYFPLFDKEDKEDEKDKEN